MSKQLKEAKDRYDEIIIPEELAGRVQDAIKLSEANREKNEKIIRMENRSRIVKRSVQTAAAVVAAFTLLLNTNTAFAEELSDVPVLGAVARVLTFRSYEKTEDDLKVSVDIPSVEMISKDTNGLADSINQEILAMCEQYAAEAVERAKEYKKAFMETGGTEEEWAAHNIEIKVWYEIKSQSEDYLSFAVMGTENWTTAYSETRYYSIDLKQEKLVTLKDLLGDDYIRIANESILSQISRKEEETGMTFFTAEEGGFAGITDNQKFYVNENGNPVIVFDKYEIAPGAAGEVEFEIKAPTEDIQLEDLAALLGMEDTATADSFGGGEENWTEDKSFYIGRIYQVSLYGESMPVYTSCDEEKIVNAVSLWIANGEREVSEEEVEQWVQRVTEFAGTEPAFNDTSSEAGSKVWKWKMDGKFVSIHWTGNILSLSMNPAVGELR